MDEQEKQAIRFESASRFWRMLVGIGLITAILLWVCLEDKHLFRYLWIAVVPLLFLIPILRYHYAVRSLTEPGGTSTAPAAAVQLVNDATRIRIRRMAARIHWFVQAWLLLMVLFAVYARWGSGKLADSFLNMQTVPPSSVVLGQFSRLFFGRGPELIPFTPPGKADARAAWADQIEEKLGQPVAVFVREGGRITWAKSNDSLAEGMAVVPRLFETDLSKDERGSIDTVGAYEVRRISNLEPKDAGFKVWMVGPLDSELRWGVVLRFDDTWEAFFNELKLAKDKSPRPDSPAWPIKDVIYLGKSNNYLTSMRVLRNGEVLYASPQLDTTRHVHRVESPPMTWEYYSSKMDLNYAKFIARTFVSWRNFVAYIVLMVTFFEFYRWIRKLTEPSAPTTAP